MITTTKEMPALDKTKPVFADIESEGLYVNCSLIQLNQDGKINGGNYDEESDSTTFIIRTDTDSEVELVKNELKDYHTVWFNGSYDLGTLNFVPSKIDDLFYAVKIAYPSIQEFSLDKVVKALSRLEPRLQGLYSGIDKKAKQSKGFVRDAYLSQSQLQYAMDDVIALNLMYKLDAVQRVMEMNLAYRLGIYALVEVAQWQQNGLPVIMSTAEKYRKDTDAKIEKLKAQLLELTGKELNPRSSKQVKEYLGIMATDKATLTRIIINGELEESHKTGATGRGIDSKAKVFSEKEIAVAELILSTRKALNDKSKLDRYIYSKMVGKFNPMGASSSRWTCKGGDLPNGINLQNYSRDFKSVFGPGPDSGKIIVAADYATLEIRIACAIMKEPSMYKALMNGEDIHKATASLIYHKPIADVHGKERSNAKVANFGLTYGMGRNTFIQYAFDLYGIKFSEEEAKSLIDDFFKGYPGLKQYHNMVGSQLRKGNYICETALGYRMKPKTYAEAINGPTQGTGAECMRLAIHLMVKKDPSSLEVIHNSIHDALYLIVNEDEKDYWGKLLQEAMVEAWEEISKSSLFHYHDIPMPVDLMFGYSMGELEEDFAGGGQALSIAEMREAKKRNKQ